MTHRLRSHYLSTAFVVVSLRIQLQRGVKQNKEPAALSNVDPPNLLLVPLATLRHLLDVVYPARTGVTRKQLYDWLSAVCGVWVVCVYWLSAVCRVWDERRRKPWRNVTHQCRRNTSLSADNTYLR